MKNIYFYLVLPLLCVSAACGDTEGADSGKDETPVFSVPQESLSVNFDDKKCVGYFTVTANCKFTAVSNQSWCKATVLRYAEQNNVEVETEENPDAGKRTAKITVSAQGFNPVEVTVTQLGKSPGILVKEKEVIITKEDLAFTLEVTSNIEVAFELPGWISKVEGTRATETNVYKFVADALPDTDFRREGTITVKAAAPEDEEQGRLSSEVKVTQYGNEPVITAVETLVSVIGNELDFTLEVTSNMEIAFELPEWIEQTAAPGTPAANTYYFRAGELPSGSNSRQGEIVVKAKDPAIEVEPVTVTVRQVGDVSLETPRFAVISDVHHGGGGSSVGSEAKVKKAIASLRGLTPAVEAIFVVGDITDYGRASDYDELLRVWKDPSVIPQDLPVYFLMGNHDHYTSDDHNVAEEMYKAKMGTTELHQYIEWKGHGFICISQRGKANSDYGTEEINFIKESIAKANSNFPGKPVFVFVHVGVENTCYGTEAGTSGWGSSAYKSAFSGHPEVILFSGHSHFPLGDPRSIHQGEFTAVNDGSSTYAEIEKNVCSEGIHPAKYTEVTEAVIVTVQPNGDVELTRWDTYRSEEIAPKWLIEAPHDGSKFKYTSALRKNAAAPEFAPGAEVDVDNVGDFTCTVKFPAAADDQNVFMYDVRIYEDGGQTAVKTYTKYSGFYLNSAAPKTFSLDFDGLTLGTGYRVEVKAMDSFYNTSAPLTATFTTTDSRPAPVTDAPAADLLDIVFNSTAPYDRSAGQYTVTVTGAPAVAFNSTTNSYLASFPGNNTVFYKFDYENDTAFKNELSQGFTLETYYMQNNTSGEQSPVSSLESGGFGFEANGSRMVYWIRGKSEGYVKPAMAETIVSGTYYHLIATYSGTNTKLYVNGVLQQSLNIGELAFGSATAQWLCIGGDAWTAANGKSQGALNGNVVFARMYKGEVSAENIAKLYRQVEYRKYVFSAPELAELLAVTLPAKASANPGQAAAINAAIGEGWEVMNNYASTEDDFAAMIAKCKTY